MPKGKPFSGLRRSAAATRQRQTILDPDDADRLLEIMEAEREDAANFIDMIGTEERSGRGASRLLSETGGRVNRTKGSE